MRGLQSVVLCVLILVVAAGGQGAAGPRIVHFVAPEYPWYAQLGRVQGDAVARASVDASGKVSSLETVRGDALLVEEMRRALLQWRFEAGQAGKLTVTFHFRIEGMPVSYRPIPKVTADLPDRVEIVVPPLEPNVHVHEYTSRPTK